MSTTRLHSAVAAAAPVLGVSVGTPGDPASVRIDFAPEATTAQRAAAQAVVAGFDWSDSAQAAWELAQNRTRALTAFVGRTDDTAIAVRLLLDAVATLANDKFEALGQGRPLTLDKLMQYVAANPTAGDPIA